MQSRIETILTKKAGKIYKEILENTTSGHQRSIEVGRTGLLPHQFIRSGYEFYLQNYPSVESLNGYIFEFLICEALLQNDISPIYYQASFSLIPNINFDVICYEERAPVSLSIKTSLRERYKQADLEAMALRQVYRNSECYLLVRTDEYIKVRSKIKDGYLFGLNDCLRADSEDFDTLIDSLKSRSFSLAEPVIPIRGRPVSSM